MYDASRIHLLAWLLCLTLVPVSSADEASSREPGKKKGALVAPCSAVPDKPLAEICAEKGITLPLRSARLIVYKAERALVLLEDDTVLKTYAIALGGAPEGPKEVEGDSRTPEGDYSLIRHRSPTFGPCFYISYPNTEDARKGLATGRISQTVKDKIERKTKAVSLPPRGTALGDHILLHGTKDRTTSCITSYDWTLGCIALENEHIDELLDSIAKSSNPRIRILPDKQSGGSAR